MIKFVHEFDPFEADVTSFAYTFPYKYSDMLKLGSSLEMMMKYRMTNIYFHRDVLALSPEKRRI